MSKFPRLGTIGSYSKEDLAGCRYSLRSLINVGPCPTVITHQKGILGRIFWWFCGENVMTFLSPCHASPHPKSVDGLRRWNYWQRLQCLQTVSPLGPLFILYAPIRKVWGAWGKMADGRVERAVSNGTASPHCLSRQECAVVPGSWCHPAQVKYLTHGIPKHQECLQFPKGAEAKGSTKRSSRA